MKYYNQLNEEDRQSAHIRSTVILPLQSTIQWSKWVSQWLDALAEGCDVSGPLARSIRQRNIWVAALELRSNQS